MIIPQETIQHIRQTLSSVEIISTYTPLKRNGKNYVGLCPFHEEKTPSFHVSEEEGVFYCFGCKKKGSIFDFVMEKSCFTFPETIKYLGNKYGIPIIENQEVNDTTLAQYKIKKEKKIKSLRCLELVSICYQESLEKIYQHKSKHNNSNEIIDYISERKITSEALQRFRIGYGTDNWGFILPALISKIKGTNDPYLSNSKEDELIEILKQLGIISENKTSGYYDVFKSRLIFPITRSDGAIIALGGRIISAKQHGPKYLNSRESELYHKRNTFYGMHCAISEISKNKQIYIVEGYFDVISMHQAGIKNVLATCGTSITTEHFGIIRRIADSVTIVFDGDEAGIKASASVFNASINSGVHVLVSKLPNGDDPDSFISKFGVESLKDHLKETFPALTSYIEQLIRQESAGKATLTDEMPPSVSARVSFKLGETIANVKNPVERDALINISAKILCITRNSMNQVVHDLLQNEKNKQLSNLYQNKTKTPFINQTTPILKSSKYSQQHSIATLTESNNANHKTLNKTIEPEHAFVCAILRKPILAKSIISDQRFSQLRSMLSGNILEFMHKLLKENDSEIENLCNCLTSLENINNNQILQKLFYLLRSFSLPAIDLFKEIYTQNQVGASRPELIIEDIAKTLNIRKLKNEMSSLSIQGSLVEDTLSNLSIGDPEIGIIQEKLTKRKALEAIYKRT